MGSTVTCELDLLPGRTAENLSLESALTQQDSWVWVGGRLRGVLPQCLVLGKNT